MRYRTQILLVALVAIAAGTTVAADKPHSGGDAGIQVAGVGEARAKPTCVEIEVKAGGLAELSSDAVVKYRDSLRRMT